MAVELVKRTTGLSGTRLLKEEDEISVSFSFLFFSILPAQWGWSGRWDPEVEVSSERQPCCRLRAAGGSG